MFDLIIIGGSAAATTAGVYAARRNLKFKIITKEFGGEVATSGEIGNWPGVIATDGVKLADEFRAHLASYHAEVEEGITVTAIERQGDGTFIVRAMFGDKPLEFATKTVLVTTGVHPRELGVPGEKQFRGKGVTYCTVCDGPVFKGKVTATVGGGNSALESALMMAELATKVYVINKNPQFKGEQVLIDKLTALPNVEIISSAMTTEIVGEQFVKAIRYTDHSGTAQELPVDGIFVHIGMVPNSDIVPTDVVRDSFKQIKVNANCETNIPGLYAAGDVTDVPFKQIVIAAGQGCIAALSIVGYLNRFEKRA